MSCRQSKKQIKSKSRSVYVCAVAVVKLTWAPTPASLARLRAVSIEGAWKSMPTNCELG